ncbi:prephenate dehydrogenase dimerization domain-containing protein, partial [Eggerthella sinensis]|uniref:prephenate dehydrogenase dimerization domain-containing protein n=1 Tax=Eggerthella sinensis TaxID=242230 RepID=UPI003A4D6C06
MLCPDADTPAEHFPRLHELVTSLGARVIALPREDHDEAVAVVSHVPHIVASSLVQLASRHADDQQALTALAAGGSRTPRASPRLARAVVRHRLRQQGGPRLRALRDAGHHRLVRRSARRRRPRRARRRRPRRAHRAV